MNNKVAYKVTYMQLNKVANFFKFTKLEWSEF